MNWQNYIIVMQGGLMLAKSGTHSVNCWNKSRCGVRLCWVEFLHNRGWAQWKGYPCLSQPSSVLGELNAQCSRVQQRTSLMYFYRAMHFSAKRGLAIACRLSVCPSVRNVGGLWSHRLKFFHAILINVSDVYKERLMQNYIKMWPILSLILILIAAGSNFANEIVLAS